MISDKALAVLHGTAKEVGFGYRDDYPHLGPTVVSAGDWKGASLAAVVFADESRASIFAMKCRNRLEALRSDVRTQIYAIPGDPDFDRYGYVVTVTGYDLVSKNENLEDGAG